ncbi:hypothetical protein AB0K60_09735 [Thermopolyspora sp. NPDC052614]|uniref:hypothetical protein n=1 Tax=Thermopolyspora sp. NPDC052614 TaxID=3155682 RepID=UPI00344839CA
MSIEWVNQAVEHMRDWGRARGVAVDLDEMRLLCDYASDYLEVKTLGDFTPDTFERLLLDIYPRKVITPPESAGETVAAARSLVDFLQDGGHVGADVAEAMRARLDEIEPEMPEALADTTRYGMAKSIFSAIDADSLEKSAELSISLSGADHNTPGGVAAGSPAEDVAGADEGADHHFDPDGDLAEASAPGLIAWLMGGVPEEAAERVVDGWLACRTALVAAGELLAAVAGAPAVVRGIAISIVDRLGEEAEEALRARLDDPELRPHAIHWLSARGLPAPALTPEEALWVSVDMLALALPGAMDDPENFAQNLAASGPPAHMIEEMWRVDHADVVEVLELLGRTLPDASAAKAARKAAFKARSRGIG